MAEFSVPVAKAVAIVYLMLKLTAVWLLALTVAVLWSVAAWQQIYLRMAVKLQHRCCCCCCITDVGCSK